MPSNVIITFQTKAETTGVDQLSQQMEGMKQKMQETAKSADGLSRSFGQFKSDQVTSGLSRTNRSVQDVGISFNQLKSIVMGTVLTLPLTGFIKEAIRSEEITARFGLQLKSLGQNINDVDIEGLTKKMHGFGFTQTELVQALNSGIRYFKDTRKELGLLDTAIGITRVTGGSLAQAMQQLGLVSLGYTRIARQLGVSTHTEIRDPAKRATAVLEDMTKKFAPLAAGTGTTAEAFKKFGASISDAGEKVGANLLIPIKEVVNVFNNLNDSTKEFLVTSVLIGSTATGLALFGKALSSFAQLAIVGKGFLAINTYLSESIALLRMGVPIVTAFSGALSSLVLPIAGVAVWAGLILMISKYIQELEKTKKAEGEQLKQEELNAKVTHDAETTHIGDIGKEIKITDDLVEREKELLAIRKSLYDRAGLRHQQGRPEAEKEALAEIAVANQRLKNIKDFEEVRKNLGIKTDDDLDRKYKQTTLTKAGYELELLNTSIEYYKRQGIAETEQGKKVIEILSKARKDALNQYVSESADANKEILGQIQDLATKTEAERNQSDQYRKAAKDIIQYASSLEQLKYKLQDASDAEKEVFKTPEGADELKKKIEELQKQAGEFAVRMDLIKDKYKDIEKTGVDSSQNINNATKVLNIEKQKSLDLTKAISEASKSDEEANSIERKIELLKKRATLDQQIEQSHKIGDAKNEARLKAESSANDKAILNLTKLNEQKKSKEAEVASKNPWAGQWTNVNQYDKQGSLKNENIGKSKQQVDLLTQQKNIEQQIAMAKEDVSDYDKEQAQFKADLMAREQEGLALAKQYASEKAKGNVEASKKIEEEMKLNVSGVDKMKSIVNEVEKSKELAKVQLQQLEAKKNQIVLSEQNVKAEQKIAEAGLKSAESQDISLNKKKEALELADKHVALEMLKKSAEEASQTEDSKKLQFYESMLNKAKEWLSLFDATAEAADVVTNAQNKSADAQDSILSKTQAQISLEEKKAELANQLKIAQSTAQQTIDKKIPEPKSPLQEKQVNTKIELRVEPIINIYPSIGELSKKAGKAVEDSVMGSQKQIEENAKKYAYQS